MINYALSRHRYGAGHGFDAADLLGPPVPTRYRHLRMGQQVDYPMQNSFPSGSSMTVQLVPLPSRYSNFWAPKLTSRSISS